MRATRESVWNGVHVLIINSWDWDSPVCGGHHNGPINSVQRVLSSSPAGGSTSSAASK